MSTVNKEIEFKYNANDIKLSDYIKLATELNPKAELVVSGFDYYYLKDNEAVIARYRADKDRPQLTLKRKLNDSNNWVRTEINLDLKPNMPTPEILKKVDAFYNELGFKRNFGILKTCFIHYWDGFNTVYYIVSDENIKEKVRFIEIEMDEDYPWTNEEQAMAKLIEVEKAFKSLGITPQARMRKSLFEIFKK